jgi:glycosyltransferase involved in cell wall biosynthesis
VVERILGNEFIDTLRATNVGLAGVSPRGNIVDKAREILLLARRLGVQNIVFWNVESTLKLIVAKALEAAAINLIDVSPGPMLFEELDVVSALQRRIAYTADDYLGRLDHFVAKYEGGLPPARFTTRPKHVHVIPNGVASPAPRSGGAPSVRAVEVDPRYALVSCCRIAPSKRIEVLIEMMAHLSRTLPQASLTIVGGVDQRHLGYFEMLQRLIGARNIHNIHFVGPSADVFGFLDEFRAFVMIARNQGCPNASLEAMAMGLPIIANPDGGTVEQVLDGQTGYLVEDDPAQLAARAIELLMDENLSRRMGRAGRDRVLNHFSLEKMTVAYQRLLEGSR